VELTEGLEAWVPHLEVHRFPRAGHWVQLDEADAESERLVEWLLRPGALTPQDLDRHRAALARPGALTAALNYYRAAGRRAVRDGVRRALSPPPGRGAPGGDAGQVGAPTLLLWGERDPALGVELTEGLEAWVPHLEVHRFPRAGHWVQLDEADAVSERLVEWLRRP
jgi:pimeloyl-ACP methyl ester carboxylesterase